MTSRTVLDLSLATLCGTLIVSIASLTIRVNALIDTLAATTQALPGALDAAVTREAARLDVRLQSIERRADGRLAAIQRDLVREVQQTRLTTLKLVDEHGIQLQELADKRTAELLLTADAHLSQANSAVTRLTDAYADVPRQIGLRLDPWTDCRKGTCLQAQTLGMIGTFRATGAEAARTGRTIRESAPAITKNFSATTANVERITRPENWKWKVLRLVVPFLTGYGVGAAR